MRQLTQRQHEVMVFIMEYLVKNMRQPTFQEIGRALGMVSTNAVWCHLSLIANKGYIKAPDKRSRGIEFTDKALEHYCPGWAELFVNSLRPREWAA